MKKTVLFVIVALLAFTNITSAQFVFDGGPDGTGTDFFDEANWVDTATGMDPAPDTINPVEVTNGVFSGGFITSDLTIGGDFAVVAEGVGEDVANIRMTNGLTLTLEDNATLNCQLLTANADEEINVVLSDNAELRIQRIARVAFDLSENANLVFVTVTLPGENVPQSAMPVFDINRINFSAAWTGSVTTQLPNENRTRLIIPVVEAGEEPDPNNRGLFDSATIDGEAAINADFSTVQFGASVIHNIPLLGDVNRDGLVNFLDIAPFIQRLSFSPSGFRIEADLNRDGITNFLDISPFIQVLAGGGQ